MQLNFLAVTALSLLASAHAAADLTGEGIVKGINELQDLSNKTIVVVEPMSKDDVSEVMPEVIKNFQGMAATGLEYIDVLGAAKNATIPKDDQEDVCSALLDFVDTHEYLLDTIVQKKDLVSDTEFMTPMGGVLRSMEAVVDQLAVSLIPYIPECKEEATNLKEEVGTQLGKAIEAYSA